jgi:hypothetical protein
MSVAKHITTAGFRAGTTFATASAYAAAQPKLMYFSIQYPTMRQGHSLPCTQG